MGINKLSSDSELKRLKYDPKDHADIFPYAEAFEEIHRKIGQDFSLRKLWEGAWANVFEIQKGGRWVYVVKLPHPSRLQHQDIEIVQKVKEEIENQKYIILRYENLVKKYDTALIEVGSNPAKQSLLHTLENEAPKEVLYKNENFSELLEKKRALSLLKIPKISEIYQGEIPIIIMDKIEWKSVWREVVNFFFKPLFSSNLAYNPETKQLEVSHSTFEESVSWLTDQALEKLLLSLFEKEEQVSNWWAAKRFLCEAYQNAWIWPDKLIGELKNKCKRNLTSELLSWLYRNDSSKQERLLTAYDSFCSELWAHPDPNLQNFIVTPDHKLWIIDFW